MIISASRRTDIPGFYMPWMLARLRAGWCRTRNPFNATQERLVSLAPEEVDALVFWTRAPGRLAQALDAIGNAGHARVAALVTLTGYGSPLEPHGPSEPVVIEGFRRLAGRLGSAGHLRWRYDPILVGAPGGADEHAERFERIARALSGSTRRVIVSFVDLYRKTKRRLARLAGVEAERARPPQSLAAEILLRLVPIAAREGMSVQTCAEAESFAAQGAPAGACIDPAWLSELFPARRFEASRDPGQREHCSCAPSIDVGLPDTCLHGCVYCYAVQGHDVALRRHATHDPAGDALLPRRGGGTPRVIGGVPSEVVERG